LFAEAKDLIKHVSLIFKMQSQSEYSRHSHWCAAGTVVELESNRSSSALLKLDIPIARVLPFFTSFSIAPQVSK
jgi:hypothetical protein